jgi:hypothetical protein
MDDGLRLPAQAFSKSSIDAHKGVSGAFSPPALTLFCRTHAANAINGGFGRGNPCQKTGDSGGIMACVTVRV